MNVLAIYCDEDKCIPKLYSSVSRSGNRNGNRSGSRSGNRSGNRPNTCMKDYSLLDNDIFDVMFNAVNMKKGENTRRYTRKREVQQVNKKSRKKKNHKK